MFVYQRYRFYLFLAERSFILSTSTSFRHFLFILYNSTQFSFKKGSNQKLQAAVLFAHECGCIASCRRTRVPVAVAARRVRHAHCNEFAPR